MPNPLSALKHYNEHFIAALMRAYHTDCAVGNDVYGTLLSLGLVDDNGFVNATYASALDAIAGVTKDRLWYMQQALLAIQNGARPTWRRLGFSFIERQEAQTMKELRDRGFLVHRLAGYVTGQDYLSEQGKEFIKVPTVHPSVLMQNLRLLKEL